MPDSRMALEADRSQPLQQFLGVGDLRPGSITSTIRRCGKPICHCAKPNDPGHDPQLRLARGVSGKTVTESFPTPAACRMAQQEVSEFHRFQVLSQELIALNEKICDGASGRAGAGGLDDPGRKTAAAIPQETAREIATLRARVFAERRKAGRTALAAMETALRDGLPPTGYRSFDRTAARRHPAPRTAATPLPLRLQVRTYVELPSKTILTVVGAVHWRRPYYLRAHCGKGQFPADMELDREDQPIPRRTAHAGGGRSRGPFDHGRRRIELLAGLKVTTKAVERTAEAIGRDSLARQQQEIRLAKQLELPVAAGPCIPILCIRIDGTGVPVVIAETQGRQGKQTGQPAHTREAKLGCVFTQTIPNAEGRRRRAGRRVLMGDGAVRIWNIGEQHSPSAVRIVGLYHAPEQLRNLAPKLYPDDGARQKRWIMTAQHTLDNGRIENLLASLHFPPSRCPEVIEMVRTEAGYFEANAERRRCWPEFRSRRLFVGAGVMEAGCKTVIGGRLKRSGMLWTVRGANAITALRCCELSGNFEDYGESCRA